MHARSSKIIGDGPLAAEVAAAAAAMPEIEWQEALGGEAVLRAMREATVLVFPSTWYEGFGLVLAEHSPQDCQSSPLGLVRWKRLLKAV